MTQTLSRERKQKFLAILEEYYQDNPPSQDATDFNIEVAGKLVEASLSRTEKTEETATQKNLTLFLGDPNDYPEHLRNIAFVLRDVWMFKLPAKPQKGSRKGQYGFYIQAMDALYDACGEFGADVLKKVHADWKSQFKNGIAPYTVAQPTSLINMASAKARELRGNKATQPERKIYDASKDPELQRKIVPAPERK